MLEHTLAWCRHWGLWSMLLLVCGLSAAQTVVRDDSRRDIIMSTPPQRIVSLLPAITEMVCELGACERLVGVDRHSNHPASVLALPRLGGMDDTPLEALIKLQPDLILVAASARVLPRLQKMGWPVMVFEPRDQADTDRMGQALSRALTGRDQAWSDYQQRQQRAWDELAAQVKPAWRGARVYVEVGEGPYVAADNSFIGQGLRRLGLHSAVSGQWGPFPRLNPEWVLRHPPDWIVLGQTARAPATRPGWEHLPTLQNRRVCVLSAAQMDTLVRPGPRLHQGMAAILACLSGTPS